jgi:hypothetical protein
MSTTAQYAITPVFGSALLTTADTSLTAPTTIGTILTAGASGTLIDFIEVQGVATSVAGIVNLFIYDGTTYSLWQQIPINAVTSSTTAVAFNSVTSTNNSPNVMPMIIPTGYSLRASTTIAQTGLKVIAYGGNF